MQGKINLNTTNQARKELVQNLQNTEVGNNGIF